MLPSYTTFGTTTFRSSLFRYRLVPTALFFLILLLLLPETTYAQGVGINSHLAEVCLAVADERDLGGGNEDHLDTLTEIDRVTADTRIIGLTGTEDIEAITFGPLGRLFAADSGFLGTLDLSSGTFTPLPQPMGTGSGAVGDITFDNIDALAYSLERGIIFGARRRGTELDLLFAIDPATGAHIPDFFGPEGGPKTDYVPVAAVLDENGNPLTDVDDMEIDPVTGVLYASMNDNGGGGNLVAVDIATGSTTRVFSFTFAEGGGIINDIEGLSFSNDGTMYASTGDNFTNAPENRNRLFRIDPTTGDGTLIGPFPVGPKDYEAIACLSAEAAIVLKKYTNGPGQNPDDADTPTGPQIEAGATVTWTYIFTNTGVLTLTNLSLVDDRIGPVAPSATNNCFASDTLLPPGKSLTCTATGIAATGQYSNVGTVTGVSVGGVLGFPSMVVSDTNPSHYIGFSIAAPAIAIKKYTNGEDADTPTGPNVTVGSTVTWTYIVSNTGNVPLDNVTVTDNQAGVTPVFVGGDTNGNGLLDLGELWLFQATGTAIEGQYANVGTVTGTPPGGGQSVSDDDPSHYFGTVVPQPLLGALGDRVWYDTNQNGIQDDDETGVPGVKVDLFTGAGTFVATTTTDANGNYLFSNLPAGDYLVEFSTPAGYSFTQYNANGNSQDAADSDPVVPLIAIHIDDGDEIALVGEEFTYTLFYTNTDATLQATDLVISTTIPAGTTFVDDASSDGWSCADDNAGSVCTINVGTLNANGNGSVALTVLLDEDDSVVPGELILLVNAIPGNPGRTETVNLGAGETDLTVDAGVIINDADAETETSTGPTNLPPNEQPSQQLELYLPSVQSRE